MIVPERVAWSGWQEFVASLNGIVHRNTYVPGLSAVNTIVAWVPEGFPLLSLPWTVSGTVQGRDNSGNPSGTQATIVFTALKPGTYVFRCTIPFNDATNSCHPDHATLSGTIIVL